MNRFEFIINFWSKFSYQLYILSHLKILNYFKFWLYIKKYIYFLYFLFLYQNLQYKKFFNIYLNAEKFLKLNNVFELKKKKISKNYIQKGYKFGKLGIYNYNIYNFEDYNIKKNIHFLFLIRFKRKNLFLTLLNNEGNVLCKTNIGSCGFKKKVKYTGYAIKRTSKIFLEKIIKSLVYNIYNTYYIDSLKKKNKKLKDKLITYIHNQQKLKYTKNIKSYNLKNLKLKIRRKINIKKSNKILKKNINITKNIIKIKKRKKNKINILKKISKKNFSKKLLKKNFSKKQGFNLLKGKKEINLKFLEFKKLNLNIYRNYNKYLKSFLKKKMKITLRIKSNLKFWGFRFVIYGLAKQFYWFRNLEIRVPLPHSTSLRLKKKRRI